MGTALWGATDADVIQWSPLAVDTDEMRVMTVPALELRDFHALPVKMQLNNNGRTGRYTRSRLGPEWPARPPLPDVVATLVDRRTWTDYGEGGEG